MERNQRYIDGEHWLGFVKKFRCSDGWCSIKQNYRSFISIFGLVDGHGISMKTGRVYDPDSGQMWIIAFKMNEIVRIEYQISNGNQCKLYIMNRE